MKTIFKMTFFILLPFVIFNSCKKEEEPLPPVINFTVGNNYTKNGDTVAVGHPLLFGIQARGNGSPITNLTVKKRLTNGTLITVMDTALYADALNINKIFYQNVEPKVSWVFSVMDRNRMSAEISLDVYKDPNSQFGGIYYFPSIKIGFQNSTVYGPFFSTQTGKVYKTDTAEFCQQYIDILCYFKTNDSPPAPALSSPGEMDNSSTDAQTFYPTIVNWTTRNYTLWDVSADTDPISVESFDAAQNDSLLIVSYNPVWGKKKFKFATTGKVIPFQTASGKTGMVKIIHADDSADGMMEISVKIQQ